MNKRWSSIKWTRESNLKQYAQTPKVKFFIRFFNSHENQYCLYITSELLPVWWMAYFQFATEVEARDFALVIANHVEAIPTLLDELRTESVKRFFSEHR